MLPGNDQTYPLFQKEQHLNLSRWIFPTTSRFNGGMICDPIVPDGEYAIFLVGG